MSGRSLRKTKTVEITVRVRVPQHWGLSIVKRELANGWFGQIFALGPRVPNGCGFLEEATLHPKFVGKARVVRGQA